jgi:hypothetical protein
MARMRKRPESNPVPPPFDRIGGWLIPIALALVALPVRLGWMLAEDLLPAFSPDIWPLLTTPSSPAYHPLNKPLLLFELIGNGLLLTGALALGVLFVRRRREFPLAAVIFLIMGISFYLGDYVLSLQLPAVAAQSGTESKLDLIGAVLIGVGLSVYFLRSARVKDTFVRGGVA